MLISALQSERLIMAWIYEIQVFDRNLNIISISKCQVYTTGTTAMFNKLFITSVSTGSIMNQLCQHLVPVCSLTGIWEEPKAVNSFNLFWKKKK